MIHHYLRLAWRTLVRQKGLASINVLGLSIGLACFSLFLLYAVHEFSYDRFHEQADRIYRVVRATGPMEGRDASWDAYMPMPLGPALAADLPDVEVAVRLRDAWGEEFVRVDDRITRQGVSYADPAFFDVFTFPFRHGDPATALSNPRHVVLTVPTAQALFGAADVVGRTLEIKIGDAFEPFTVAAVAEALPANSSIRFGVLASYAFYAETPSGQRYQENWRRSAFQTFVRVREGSTLPGDADRLLSFRRTYYPDEVDLRERGRWLGEGPPVTYELQPLRTLHTDTRIASSADPVEPRSVWMLLALAGGVLLIACINFTTLAIGRSAGRAKEVGVRKALGSDRGQLAAQFLAEALLLSLLAAALGLALAQLAMPYFNDLAGRSLTFSFTQYPEVGALLAVVVVAVGLLAGSYPAFVLSGFRPVEVLKSRARMGGANAFTRLLVTVQFALSIGLIAATFVVVDQVHFLQGSSPGFDQENVVVVDADGTDTEAVYPRFQEALAKRPEIAGVTAAELSMGADQGWSRTGWDYHGEYKSVFEYFVGDDYLEVMGLELVAGRPFEAARTADTTVSVIVNEAFVRDFGWTPEMALGQPLDGYSSRFTPAVVGVVRDFHFRPLRDDVQPQLFHQYADYRPYKYFVRLRPGSPAEALAAIRTAWQQAEPTLPLRYSFLDDDLDRFYRAEVRFAKIMGWAGGLAIFLASLGLFGLAALAAVNRTKEIGIRKVLGAQVHQLVGVIARGFVVLVVLAAVLVLPIVWLLMRDWLATFAYRTAMPWEAFVGAGLLAVTVALVTITAQTLRTARANPVDALRSE